MKAGPWDYVNFFALMILVVMLGWSEFRRGIAVGQVSIMAPFCRAQPAPAASSFEPRLLGLRLTGVQT